MALALVAIYFVMIMGLVAWAMGPGAVVLAAIIAALAGAAVHAMRSQGWPRSAT
ncbi:MAG TPA: hypothetical protein VHE35_32490 [Kofleriaceae bacterium]|nr:hypothetical protein [Kofleriaceae bacterium]